MNDDIDVGRDLGDGLEGAFDADVFAVVAFVAALLDGDVVDGVGADVAADLSRVKKRSTIEHTRGWLSRMISAPAACRALAMCQPKPTSSDTPVTSATLPVRLRGPCVMCVLLKRAANKPESGLSGSAGLPKPRSNVKG